MIKIPIGASDIGSASFVDEFERKTALFAFLQDLVVVGAGIAEIRSI